MSVSKRRVRAIFRKELREYRRNGNIISAMVVFPAFKRPFVAEFLLR